MYVILRASVRMALRLYCGPIRTMATEPLPKNVPLLFACNHPNSFFDALVIATQMDQRMYFLTRGDVFRKPVVARILSAMNMIPIHRLSEGRSELHLTEHSFDRSHEVLKSGDSLLIFSEGLSVNETGLRSLGKGTGRIAYRSWYGERTTPLIVVPTWLCYDTFKKPFMAVTIATGEPMLPEASIPLSEPVFLRAFNDTLRADLLVLSDHVDAWMNERDHGTRPSIIGALFATVAGLFALLLHAPWYYALRFFTARKTKGTVFFDSVLFGLLFLSYPLWLLALLPLSRAFGLSWLNAFVVVINAPLWAFLLGRSQHHFTLFKANNRTNMSGSGL